MWTGFPFSSSSTLCSSTCEILPPYFLPALTGNEHLRGSEIFTDGYSRFSRAYVRCPSYFFCRKWFFFHLAHTDFMPLWVCFCLACPYFDLMALIWCWPCEHLKSRSACVVHLKSVQNSDVTLVLAFWALETLSLLQDSVGNIRNDVINEENLKRLLYACEWSTLPVLRFDTCTL